ncbi:hypothetical protein ACFPM7_00810 [Actinokineospora guangxiensis]|uniref:Uncharacterized protein n=1 Tax=Actinokineospora guangxiensis TaxID=1490288 RepID=A0ABW0EF47_9PSEU
MRRSFGVAVTAALAALLAAPGAAAAPLPFLAVDCGQSVHALRGQPVHLSRVAVSRMVAKAARDELGGLAAAAVGLAFPLGGSIPVGTVPDGAGEIAGEDIAEAVVAVVAPMREIAPAADAVTASVRELVTDGCGMAVRAINPTGDTPGEVPGRTDPPGPPGHSPGGDPSTTPNAQPVGGGDAGPDEVSLYDPAQFARTPPRDYGGIPVAEAGRFAPSPAQRYGCASGCVPGYSPEFGLLGGDPGISTAGGAQALPVDGAGRGQVAFPVLAAVLLLSVLTGALVRTWVLRRT